jgi:transposase
MPAFSLDLRTRVLADYQAGLTFAELGRKYTTSAEWARLFIRRYETTGEIEARPPINHRVPFYRRHEREIRQAVADNPSLTLEALRTQLGVECDLTTIWTALRALKISFKKKRLSPPSNKDPMSSKPGKSSTRSSMSA